jgi:hypothetical protein
MDNDSARDEYTRMVELLKHYATLQFAELSVFIGVMGAAILFLFGVNTPRGAARVFLLFGMSLAAMCLWVIHESNSKQMWHFLKRAAQLETQLGYQGYSKLPGMLVYRLGYWIGPGSLAFRFLYLVVILFWLSAGFGRFPEPAFAPDPKASNQVRERTDVEAAPLSQAPVAV